MELTVTVISAQDLKPRSSALFARRLRPFITLTLPSTNGDKPIHVYKTRVDDAGGINPSWGDKFQIPIDNSTTSFYQRHSQYYYPLIYLQLYTKDFLMGGRTQLGWCQIPAADILDGLSPAGYVRLLSYQLRARDGSRGHGVVNIAVKMDGSGPVCTQSQRACSSDLTHLPVPEMGFGQTVIGIPVRMLPTAEICPGKN